MEDNLPAGGTLLASALAKQGQLEGYAVGGCCDLSTSVHHLVDKLGTELGYLMSEDTGYDVEDCITLATKGLKLRVARRVWRDYYRHSFAGCCELSTSVHHLVDKLGVELGYRMSEDTGYDVEDCITCATKGLKLRVARGTCVSGATITDTHSRAGTTPIHRRKA